MCWMRKNKGRFLAETNLDIDRFYAEHANELKIRKETKMNPVVVVVVVAVVVIAIIAAVVIRNKRK